MFNVVNPNDTGYVISHSAKGSTWEKHKYLKKINGLYYYPSTHEKGRKIESLIKESKLTGTGKLMDSRKDKKNKDEKTENKKSDLSDVDKKKRRKQINELAKAVIRGEYGVGQERIDKIGKKYSRVQNRVNQMLLGKDAAKRIEDRKKAASSATAKVATKKITTKQKKVDSRKK